MKQDIRVVFPLLFKFMLILCFFIFPLLLLSSSVQSYFKIQTENRKEQLTRKAEKKLAILQQLSDGPRYFHHVFSKLFKKNHSGSKLRKNLAKKIKFLKSRFPNSLKFIIWDKSGNLVKSISDEKSYVFFLNKLNDFLKRIQKLTIKSYPRFPSLTQELKKEKRNFKKFLGPFIPTAKIAESFIPGKKGRCFQMQPQGDKSYGWYRAHKNYSILIYISHEAINSLKSCKTICQKYFRKKNQSKILMFNKRTGESFPETHGHLKRKIKINLEKKANLSSFQKLESENYFYCFQNLKKGWWAVALINKAEIYSDKNPLVSFILQIIITICIFSFIGYCFLLVHNNPLNSISARLIVIFTYTVAIPVMIFATTGFDYVSEMTSKIESDTSAQLLSFLNKLDTRFTSFSEIKARKLTKIFNTYFKTHPPEKLTKIDSFKFADMLKQEFKPDILMFFDQTGQDKLEQKYSRHMIDNTFSRTMAKTVLNYFNNIDPTRIIPVSIIVKPSLNSFTFFNRKINHLNLGKQPFYFYSYMAKASDSPDFNLFLQIFWDIKTIHNLYFEELKKDFKQNAHLKPILYFPETKATLHPDHDWPELNNFLRKVEIHGSQLEELKTPDSSKVIAAGFRGSRLKNTVVAATISYDSIYKRIQNLKIKLIILLIMTVLFSLSLYLLLSNQILVPVNQLIKGVEFVRTKSYQKRVDFTASNEFGSLANSINHTLENLQEFEIARIVQESLLPSASISNEHYEIEGRTDPMSKLGGDYFDFFINQNRETLLLLGDVAGHGVQAALMMAMAKSVFMLEQNQAMAHLKIMDSLNNTFLKLRKSSIKTMMTGQVLLLNNDRNSYFINAGHTSPLLITEDSIQTIESPSYPLGFSKNRQFKPIPFQLNANNIMLLYTDGIIESLNAKGEILGNEGFFELVKKARSKNLKEFQANLFSLYNEWTQIQNDDLTFVLIKRKKNV
ncbi:MAG: SpoIIE family protein phosphatase [Candidatus Rifleibacteriota bacterium]